MRKLFVAGNWKMNLTIAEAKALVSEMLPELEQIDNVDQAVCPSYLAVPAVAELCKGTVLKVGAQNVYWEKSGAFTAEVAPDMVAEICDYVIVGHSERRALFGETDETVNKRLKAALEAGLDVIVCVGETLDENQSGQTKAVVTRQIEKGLADITAEQAAHITIAYEPVWAIGTGLAATPEDANNVHKDVIRPLLKKQFGEERAEAMRIQYGGSIKPNNAKELFSMSDIDGGLVGGASLKAASFWAIVKAASEV
ncbi:MAG: triose-phosphate isomerase [Anaerolineaceae bacterium]|jgi:triosephosphate isomerase|nr:triose-phosphate isomerase [Anaerolineaceae bacterium]